MTVLSYKTKLSFRTPEDKQNMLDTLLCHKNAYNFCSNKIFALRTTDPKAIHQACYYSMKSEFPDIPSQIAIRAERECLSDYKTLRSNNFSIDKPIQRKQLTLGLDHRLHTRIAFDTFKITNINGKRLTAIIDLYPKLVEMLNTYTIKSPRVCLINNILYMILFFEIPDSEIDTDLMATGVDLGFNRPVALSNGKIIKDKKYNASKRKLRFLKSKLRKAKSLGSRQARRKLKKLSKGESNKTLYQTHLLANWIIKNSSSVIVIEDLSGIKTINRGHKLNNKLSQVPFALLRKILEYKAPLKGKTVKVVEAFNTSKINHRSNLIDGKRKGSRYICPDNIVLDADINAAINIAYRSKLPISSCKGLDGQVVVNQPITRIIT